MFLHVDTANGIPIYVQLINQIKSCIAGGILIPGDRMPSVRELASQLTVNPNTIQKAYQELEQAGIIETVRGRGTFVYGTGTGFNEQERRKKLEQHVQALLVEAYHLNFGKDELKKIFDQKLEMWDGLKGGSIDE